MIAKLLSALCLVAITVTIHAAGLGMVLSHVLHSKVEPEDTRFWPITWLLVRIAWLLIVIHLFAIFVWAVFFWLAKCLPDIESAFYFSAVTYATIGYGDLVLPREWRMFGPIEGFTGILMFGLSTAFFFIVVSKSVLHLADEKRQA
jgi:ion channel